MNLGSGCLFALDNSNETVDAQRALYMAYISVELSGFGVYAATSGGAFVVSALCSFYLLLQWQRRVSHYIIAAFSLVLSAYNVIAFALMARLIDFYTQFLFGGSGIDIPLSFVRDFSEANLILTLSFVPVFLWISDGFLLYRCWVIWTNRRIFVTLPALVYLGSIISGVIWLFEVRHPAPACRSIVGPVLVLSLSCGVDMIMTAMIAGRLIYYHRLQNVLNRSQISYLPFVVVFVESAALSLLSKILQLAIVELEWHPFVIPLSTISSNLIVLRKAVGAKAVPNPASNRVIPFQAAELDDLPLESEESLESDAPSQQQQV